MFGSLKFNEWKIRPYIKRIINTLYYKLTGLKLTDSWHLLTWCRIRSCPKYRGGVGLLSKDRGGAGIGSEGWGLGRRGCKRRSEGWAKWRSLTVPKSTSRSWAECKRWRSCRWSCWGKRNKDINACTDLLSLKPKRNILQVFKHRPEDEAAEGAAAPKPKDGGAAAAGGAAALVEAPKMNGWAGVGAGVEFRGAADGAEGWLSWLWPKTKAALAAGASVEVDAGCPNMNELGAGAWEEPLPLLLLVAPNTLGAGTDEEDTAVVFVGLLAMKENAGFGAADESVGGV